MDARIQQQHAETFHALHRTGDPLVLFNAWDVATAKAIAKASPAVRSPPISPSLISSSSASTIARRRRSSKAGAGRFARMKDSTAGA